MTSSEADDKLGPLMDEFLERKRNGEYPSLTEFVQRHPELESEIRELFPAVAMMEQAEPSEPARGAMVAVTGDGRALTRLGDFRVIREIGRGGMGIVYEAIQESLGRHVALKLLPWQSIADNRQVKRFQREARIAASLHHSNIVPVYGVGEADGVHFLAMQFIHGQSLDSVLSELKRLKPGLAKEQTSPASVEDVGPTTPHVSGRSVFDSPCSDSARRTQLIAEVLSRGSRNPDHRRPAATSPSADGPSGFVDAAVRSPTCDVTSQSLLQAKSGGSSTNDYFRTAARLIAQAADALEYAHSQGVLHRDIKPANLMLDVDGNIWITDFGLARPGNTTDSQSADDPDAESLTQTGDLVGTLRYLAPERFEGANDVRSDVYSLGLTLYEFLTLEPAFRAADRITLIRLITTSNTPPPRAVVPEIPRDLETIVVKAIHADPFLRYQSAAEMASDLRRFLNDEPIVARRSSPWKRAQLWCRRNPAVAVLSGLAVTLLVAVTIVSSVAAIMLSSRQKALLFSLDRATRAEVREREANRLATVNLFEAYSARAKSGRETFRPGRRVDGLDAIASAAALRDQLTIDGRQIMNLRNEAIACLGLVDVSADVDRPDHGIYAAFGRWGFDSRIERYARIGDSSHIDILTVDDGRRLSRLSDGWTEKYPPLTCFSPDDRYLAIFGWHRSGSCRVEIWDLESGSLVLPAVQSSAEWHCRSVTFSSDSRRAAWIGNDQLIVFDLATRRVLKSRPLNYAPAFVRFCPSGCHVAIGWGDAVAVFRWQEDGDMMTLGHAGFVQDATFSSDGRFLATACFDHGVHVWDLQRPSAPVTVCDGHTSKALRVEFSPDDRVLMSNAWDDTTRLWNPWSGRQLVRIDGYASQFSADGSRLALQQTGVRVGRWNLSGSDCCRALSWKTGDSGIFGADFHPDGTLLAHTAGHQVVVRSWPSGHVLHELRVPDKTFNVKFAANGRFLYCSTDGQFVRWDGRLLQGSDTAAVEATRQDISGTPGARVTFDLVADGTSAVVCRDGRVAWMELTESALRPGNDVPASPLDWFVSVTRDGCRIALTGKFSNVVSVLQASNHEVLFRHELPSEQTTDVLFDPTGKLLLLSTRGRLLLFETGEWNRIGEIPLRNSGFGRATFSPDGSQLAVHDGEAIHLLRTDGLETLARLQNPDAESYSRAGPEATTALAFSADQRFLASGTGGEQELLYVWDLGAVRQQLATVELDWDAAPLPASPSPGVSIRHAPSQCLCPVGNSLTPAQQEP